MTDAHCKASILDLLQLGYCGCAFRIQTGFGGCASSLESLPRVAETERASWRPDGRSLETTNGGSNVWNPSVAGYELTDFRLAEFGRFRRSVLQKILGSVRQDVDESCGTVAESRSCDLLQLSAALPLVRGFAHACAPQTPMPASSGT